MSRRTTIGIIGWLLLIVGTGLFFFGPKDDTWYVVSAAGIRVGALMLALWLAYRHLARVPMWLYGCTLTVLILIAARPKWALWLGPTIVALWLLRPRPSKTEGTVTKKTPPSTDGS
jgi:hypothetical protein